MRSLWLKTHSLRLRWLKPLILAERMENSTQAITLSTIFEHTLLRNETHFLQNMNVNCQHQLKTPKTLLDVKISESIPHLNEEKE